MNRCSSQQRTAGRRPDSSERCKHDDAAGHARGNRRRSRRTTPIVTIPAGVPITESMLLGPGLADHAPAGTVLAPIHVSDPSVLSLLRVGDRVDLYMSHADLGAGDSGAKLVSSDVQVMAFPSEGGSGGGFLSLDESNDAMFFGAIARRDANLFTGSSGLAPFRVVLTTAQD